MSDEKEEEMDEERLDEENEDGEGEDGENEDGEEGEGEDGESSGGLNPKKLALLIGVPLILLIGGGAGLYFTGMLDGLLGVEEEVVEEEDDIIEEKSHGGVFLEVPNIVVNLSSSDGQPRFLRLSIQLELASEDDMKAIEGIMPRVIDQFQTFLRELRVRDLRGSAGIYRLQMELLSRVNAAAYPIEVDDVLFQEILIQ